MLRLLRNGLRALSWLAIGLLVAGCAQPAAQPDSTTAQSTLPADLSGYWERDYFRGDDVNRALDQWFRRLRRGTPDLLPPGLVNLDNSGTVYSSRDVSSILALARLADEITRLRYFSIAQTEGEISVARENDFDISCEFSNGTAQGAATPYGAEVCGWNGEQFISRLVLPDGLLVSHRFTVAPEGQDLHVATTVASTSTGMAFTLSRFYTKYDPGTSQFECIETLSRNRVCATGGLPLLD